LKRYVLMLAVMALLMVALAVPAFAAAPVKTVPGLPEQGTDHANSICAFSGLNDVPLDPEEGGLVQSYGQIVGSLAKIGVHVNAGPGPAAPGTQCNAHLYPYPPGPPEG
jgi:hypothetical protein